MKCPNEIVNYDAVDEPLFSDNKCKSYQEYEFDNKIVLRDLL